MKTLFITGASSGIGNITARLFQSKGWNVAAAVRQPESLADLAALPRVRVYQIDVTKPDSISSALENALRDFGGIDVVVNNAGYAAVGPFEAASDEQIRKQFETNVFGLMNVTRAILPHFRSRRSGTIINLSSVGGQITFPLYSLYHATKFAVEGFTESLAYELRPFGIKLRLIEPGVIKTDFYTRSMDKASATNLPDYEPWATTVLSNAGKSVEHAPGPEVVAARIWQAANHRGSKLRWMVGREGIFVMLKRIIPNSWFFGVVRSNLGA